MIKERERKNTKKIEPTSNKRKRKREICKRKMKHTKTIKRGRTEKNGDKRERKRKILTQALVKTLCYETTGVSYEGGGTQTAKGRKEKMNKKKWIKREMRGVDRTKKVKKTKKQISRKIRGEGEGDG